MKIDSFEQIYAWQKAKELSLFIYRTFRHCNDYSFKRQIERASVSIMNNIAEGFERRTNKEFINFLFIAKGSAAEVRSMLSLAVDLDYISKKDQDFCFRLSMEISRMLSGLIKKL